MNILVVDDQADIREIMAFLMNHELKATIVTAISGNKAIDILKNQNFDIVVCDYNMPDGNGLLVHDYIKTSSPATKFVFCSSESDEVLNQADNVFFHIKKPNVFDYIRELKKKLSTMDELNIDTSSNYSEISLCLAQSLHRLPFDLYLKLSENNYVKYFSATHELTEADTQTIKSKGMNVLYLRSEDIIKAKGLLLELISKALLEIDGDNSVHQAVAAQEYVTKYFREFGYDAQVQEMAMENLKQTMNLIMKEKDIDEFLVKLLGLSSYSRKLYAVTVCFSAMLLRPIQLLNDHTLSKMIAAIYLQDLFVGRVDLLVPFTKTEIQDLPWKNHKEQEIYFMHPVKASEFVKKTDSIPPDVDRLIMESHELPSGKGFPRGLTASQISPLSCVLILANLLSREFLRFETVFSTTDYLKFLNRKHGLEEGNFKKVYDAALAIDFFPKK